MPFDIIVQKCKPRNFSELAKGLIKDHWPNENEITLAMIHMRGGKFSDPVRSHNWTRSPFFTFYLENFREEFSFFTNWLDIVAINRDRYGSNNPGIFVVKIMLKEFKDLTEDPNSIEDENLKICIQKYLAWVKEESQQE